LIERLRGTKKSESREKRGVLETAPRPGEKVRSRGPFLKRVPEKGKRSKSKAKRERKRSKNSDGLRPLLRLARFLELREGKGEKKKGPDVKKKSEKNPEGREVRMKAIQQALSLQTKVKK